jgi:UPF0755 protein
MKKYFVLLALLASLIAALVIGNIWWGAAAKPVSGETAEKDFLIVRGSSAAQIGTKLEKEGLIRSSLAFRLYVQATGKAKSIQAGEYSLSPSYSLLKMVDILSNGPIEVWVTIPEGLRREEIAQRFADGLGKADKQAFVQEFLNAAKAKEGYLFPDTYLFPKTASASAVVNKMLATFDIKIAELQEGIENSDLSLNEIVTLASIVERETRTSEERPVVAGILINRLDINMGLAADATVQYAVANAQCPASPAGGQMLKAKCDDWWPILTREDIAINSPYNTYKYRGLPPTPIASPGLSSLRAAVFPEDSDYLYYLHDAKGEAHYARTLEEHNANIAKFLE